MFVRGILLSEPLANMEAVQHEVEEILELSLNIRKKYRFLNIPVLAKFSSHSYGSHETENTAACLLHCLVKNVSQNISYNFFEFPSLENIYYR